MRLVWSKSKELPALQLINGVYTGFWKSGGRFPPEDVTDATVKLFSFAAVIKLIASHLFYTKYSWLTIGGSVSSFVKACFVFAEPSCHSDSSIRMGSCSMNVDGCFSVQAQLVQSELACCPAVQSYSVSITVVPAPAAKCIHSIPSYPNCHVVTFLKMLACIDICCHFRRAQAKRKFIFISSGKSFFT